MGKWCPEEGVMGALQVHTRTTGEKCVYIRNNKADKIWHFVQNNCLNCLKAIVAGEKRLGEESLAENKVFWGLFLVNVWDKKLPCELQEKETCSQMMCNVQNVFSQKVWDSWHVSDCISTCLDRNFTNPHLF